MPMNVKDAIDARHSVRAFSKEPLPREDLMELLEAARNAPSSLNSQPWRFKLVTTPEDLAWFGTSEATRKQAWMAGAGAIVVCCVDLEGYVKDSQSMAFFMKENKFIEGEPMDGIEDYVSRQQELEASAKFGACAMNMGIAVSFMMLRAVEMGLGTCWVGMFNEANVKQRLNIPEGYRVVNLLAIGRPDEKFTPPRHRKSMDEIVF